jgi:ABC-2 type transport system ATP-binding protein
MKTFEQLPRPGSDAVVVAAGLTRRFGSFTAVDDISFTLRRNMIYGLLGRNGAGKTTLMRLMTGQLPLTAGQVDVFGDKPFENAAVVSQICFVSENQCYPDGYRVHQVLGAGRLLFDNWDADLAASLVHDFGLPLRRQVKKLSRGMQSALGIVVGLAAQAPLTLFDEPYLGLDASARQLFYDRLLAEYTSRPRTVVLSTHLIDEVSDLLEHVLLIDDGRLAIDEEADSLRGRAISVSGRSSAVGQFVGARARLHSEQLAGQSKVTMLGEPSDAARAGELGLRLEPVSLQQLVVHATGRRETRDAGPAATDAQTTGTETTGTEATNTDRGSTVTMNGVPS